MRSVHLMWAVIFSSLFACATLLPLIKGETDLPVYLIAASSQMQMQFCLRHPT